MRKFFVVVAAAIPAIAGIGAALAFASKGSRRRLGAADPWADTGEPEINSDDYKIAPGSYSDEDNHARPTRDEPGYDGGCLILGRKFQPLRSEPYRVCLTHNQEQKLFKGKRLRLRKLGCGVFACAYESPAKTRVVKITRDSEDVAALLQAQKTGVVPKVHAVYKLKQGGRTNPGYDQYGRREGAPEPVDAYALVIDRLRTIPASEQNAVSEELAYVRFAIKTADQRDLPLTIKNVCRLTAQFTKAAKDDDDTSPAGPVDGCTPTQALVLDAVGKLRKKGIDWSDIHAGNIGYDKAGRLKVIDLGVSKTELKKEPEILEGRLAAASQRLNLLDAI